MDAFLVSTGLVALAHKLPVSLVHKIAAAIFAMLGIAVLMGLDQSML